MERQIRLQIKALKAVQEVYDETKIPTIHKLTKVVQERILREKGEYIAGIEEQAQYLHEIFDQFLDEAEVLSPHRGAEKSKEAKKNKAKADESFGRDAKPFDIDQTGDDDVGIAALNLVLDFDFIEEGAEKGLPKYMEWYGAFSLMVTLVWLYLEILRLLMKIRSR